MLLELLQLELIGKKFTFQELDQLMVSYGYCSNADMSNEDVRNAYCLAYDSQTTLQSFKIDYDTDEEDNIIVEYVEQW